MARWQPSSSPTSSTTSPSSSARRWHVGPHRPRSEEAARMLGLALARLPRGRLAPAAGRHLRGLDRLPLRRDLVRYRAAAGRPARHHRRGRDLPPDGDLAGPAHRGRPHHPADDRRGRAPAGERSGAGRPGPAATAAWLGETVPSHPAGPRAGRGRACPRGHGRVHVHAPGRRWSSARCRAATATGWRHMPPSSRPTAHAPERLRLALIVDCASPSPWPPRSWPGPAACWRGRWSATGAAGFHAAWTRW